MKKEINLIRHPQVAGQFYSANPAALKKELELFLLKKQEKKDVFGLLAPHAGYMFSGKVAGACYSHINLTKTVIILGPNHTGLGPQFSIMTEGTWQMPLGDVVVDGLLAKSILEESQYLREDFKAHLYEHSIEVQLPFLQFLLPQVKIVPIIISSGELRAYNEIANAMAKTIKKSGKSHLIIASSDMTHYQPQKKAQENDNLAIEAILKLDERELLNRIEKLNITMCGYGPTACMLSAAKKLGAKAAHLIKYETSGEASGDYSSVVGYAGILVE